MLAKKLYQRAQIVWFVLICRYKTKKAPTNCLRSFKYKKLDLVVVLNLFVGVDDFFNEPVAHNVFVVEIDDSDAFDIFQN